MNVRLVSYVYVIGGYGVFLFVLINNFLVVFGFLFSRF